MLKVVLNNAKNFYKVEKNNILLAEYQGMNCFNIKCYDIKCGCSCTDSCDLEIGENIKSIFPTAIEIHKEEFMLLWNKCKNQYN